MKCRACGASIIIFSDGWVTHVLEKPRYGKTQYHYCEQGKLENEKMLPKAYLQPLRLPAEQDRRAWMKKEKES